MANLIILPTTAASAAGRTINEQTFISKSLTKIDCCQPIHTILTTLSTNNNNNYYCDKNHYNTNVIVQKQSKNNCRSYENILRPQNISASTSCINTTNYERNLCQTNYAVIKGDENVSTKHFKFKSNVIAKKGKFWKFLEEEKLKKTSADDLQKYNCGKCSSRWRKQNYKSSSELYREAAQLLGLSCTLSDSCRCLDCQSRYFDYDDSDSTSEPSMGIETEMLFNRCHNLTVPVIRYKTHRSLETLSLPNTPESRKKSTKCESFSDISIKTYDKRT